MKLLYFAWLKDKTGVAAEEVALPAEVTTVAELLAWLSARGPGYARRQIRVISRPRSYRSTKARGACGVSCSCPAATPACACRAWP